MKLTFLGAARGVTGSCFLIETKKTRALVDCGMFQGSDFNEKRNRAPFPFDPKSIDVIFVTHAHIDHNGRIPKLIHDGFAGKVYATKGTTELMQVVWADALKVMQYDYKKFGAPLLFHEEDLMIASTRCRGVEYEEVIDLSQGRAGKSLDITVTFHDAGHILGSSFIELEAENKRIIFSGDLGNTDVPILRDTSGIKKPVDVLLVESTYGDRKHESRGERQKIILDAITKGLLRGGTLLIPAFSIERTQELLYELNELIERKHTLPRVPIFLDSPLAISAMQVYHRHPEYYDTDAKHLRDAGDDFFQFPGLTLTRSRDESKEINAVRGPKIIIAGSGMMNGGRIVHHALRYLSDPKSTVLIIGYCAEGTLGRRLYEGAEQVTIMGQRVRVRATIKSIGALSAHADQDTIIAWVGTAKGAPKRIYTVHGEPHAATELAHRLQKKFSDKTQVSVPEEGQVVEI